MTTDPIADMLTRIRNAASSNHVTTTMPGSKVKEQIARILKEAGFIADYEMTSETPRQLTVILGEDSSISNVSLVRVSKPGRRVYSAATEIPRVLGGRGIMIVSTSHGIMTGSEARKRGLGGELICKVW